MCASVCVRTCMCIVCWYVYNYICVDFNFSHDLRSYIRMCFLFSSLMHLYFNITITCSTPWLLLYVSQN